MKLITLIIINLLLLSCSTTKYITDYGVTQDIKYNKKTKTISLVTDIWVNEGLEQSYYNDNITISQIDSVILYRQTQADSIIIIFKEIYNDTNTYYPKRKIWKRIIPIF